MGGIKFQNLRLISSTETESLRFKNSKKYRLGIYRPGRKTTITCV